MRDTSFVAVPIRDHAFFQQAVFQRQVSHAFLQGARFAAQIVHVIRGRGTGDVASQALRARTGNDTKRTAARPTTDNDEKWGRASA